MFQDLKKPVKILDLIKVKKPLIIGILNITPDSFSDGGQYFQIDDAIKHAKKLIQDGVDILDIGGESTRPGAKLISEEEESKRVIPVVSVIARRFKESTKQYRTFHDNSIETASSAHSVPPRNDKSVLISIDTYKSNVARLALTAGANMINDVSGLTMDLNMVKVAQDTNCPIVIMHNNGIPATKPLNALRHCEEARKSRRSNLLTFVRLLHRFAPRNDVFSTSLILKEVYSWLQNQTNFAIKNGIKRENIIIDPGIGFGKTAEEDFELIKNLKEFKSLGFPILVGLSRKSFIRKLFPKCNIEIKSKEMIELAIRNGADIVRVHSTTPPSPAL